MREHCRGRYIITRCARRSCCTTSRSTTLLFVIICIFLYRLTRAETSIIHLNLVLALAVAQIVFLTGIEATQNKVISTFYHFETFLLNYSHAKTLKSPRQAPCNKFILVCSPILNTFFNNKTKNAVTRKSSLHLLLFSVRNLINTIFNSITLKFAFSFYVYFHQAACKIVAVLLHYFNLVSFSWMLVEGVWLYVMIVRVFETGHSRIKKYCACAWGKPTIWIL